ncbi:hypothetical protein MBT42_00540 [Streptomyces sp. MBT42]|uniref:hypothetical protein n=1 Tax=Streptomyces sp. MBT42 TaxID=1488373 RepID=UPI001E502FC1|nr:hypothetical protein [Streptomyces sp. MBT42]MCD2462043.1 hypothetical protein [Streptomyces sp. MBT42]
MSGKDSDTEHQGDVPPGPPSNTDFPGNVWTALLALLVLGLFLYGLTQGDSGGGHSDGYTGWH